MRPRINRVIEKEYVTSTTQENQQANEPVLIYEKSTDQDVKLTIRITKEAMDIWNRFGINPYDFATPAQWRSFINQFIPFITIVKEEDLPEGTTDEDLRFKEFDNLDRLAKFLRNRSYMFQKAKHKKGPLNESLTV